MVLAKLIQAAEIGRQDRVLDVACATGYSSAVLARLARSVVALEEDATLARHARENLAALGAANAEVVTRPVARRLAGRRALRRHPRQRRGRSRCPSGCCASSRRAGGWSGSSGGRRRARRCVYLAAGGQASALPIFDAAAPALPGFAAAAGIRVLIPPAGIGQPSFPQRSVARKTQAVRVFHAIVPRRYPQGFRKALRSRLWLTPRVGTVPRVRSAVDGAWRCRVVAWGLVMGRGSGRPSTVGRGAERPRCRCGGRPAIWLASASAQDVAVQRRGKGPVPPA